MVPWMIVPDHQSAVSLIESCCRRLGQARGLGGPRLGMVGLN